MPLLKKIPPTAAPDQSPGSRHTLPPPSVKPPVQPPKAPPKAPAPASPKTKKSPGTKPLYILPVSRLLVVGWVLLWTATSVVVASLAFPSIVFLPFIYTPLFLLAVVLALIAVLCKRTVGGMVLLISSLNLPILVLLLAFATLRAIEATRDASAGKENSRTEQTRRRQPDIIPDPR